MEDVAPKLLEQIKDLYFSESTKNELIAVIQTKIKDKQATYIDAEQYANELGEILANAYKETFVNLPDGKMYYNIAKRTVEPTMMDMQSDIADITDAVQTVLNEQAGLGINPIRPVLEQNKIDGILNRLAHAESYDDIAWILAEPIKTFARSTVDDAIKSNAEFHAKAGMSPKIVRKMAGNCCDWCKAVAGTYIYPDVPKDVYRRHQRCRCTVDYVVGKRKQNVWNKAWSDEVEPEKIEQRKVVKYGEDVASIEKTNTASIQEVNDIATKAIKDSYEYRRIEKGISRVPYDKLDSKQNIKADFTGMDARIADTSAKQFALLSNEYNTTCETIIVEKFDQSLGSAPAATEISMNIHSSKMSFNKNIVKDGDKYKERTRKAVERGQFPQMAEEMYDKYVVTHEFAHTLMDFESPLTNYVGAETKHIRNARKEIEAINKAYKEEIRSLTVEQRKAEMKALETFDEDDWKKAQELTTRLKEVKISEYADMSVDEFMAEAFAEAKLGSNPSDYSKRVEAVIDKYFKK